MTEVTYRIGFREDLRMAAAELFDEAFSAKLAPAIPDRESRLAVLERGLDPTRCVAALATDQLVGIAGFHDAGGSLTGGISFRIVVDAVGYLRALRAIAVFALLDRKPEPGELLMDGIVVREDARGRGVGTGMFAALEDYCREHGISRIRLDVLETNPGARRLYERLGFEPTKQNNVPFLKPIMGFGASTTMVKRLD